MFICFYSKSLYFQYKDILLFYCNLMDNNLYAIQSILQKMTDDKRNKLFSLTNLIIQLQQKHGEQLLNVSEEQVGLFANDSSIGKDDYKNISDIYVTYALFNEIKNCTSKGTFIRKMRPAFEGSADFMEELKRMLNVVVLVNLLQKRLKNKTIQELTDYQFISQLERINSQLPTYLCVSTLSSFTTDAQITDFVKEEYNSYDEIMFEEIYALYDSHYPDIYELIHLFQ